QVAPREYWRLTLLRAYAAFRRGNADAGALAARAFEEAARLGLAHLPYTKEGAITEELLGLAVETGQPPAPAPEVAALPRAGSGGGGGAGVGRGAGRVPPAPRRRAGGAGPGPADTAAEDGGRVGRRGACRCGH